LVHTIVLLSIVLSTYVLLVTERLHRTTAVLLGAALVIALRYVTPQQAWARYIDYNTLGLLLGMMVIVAIMRKSGLFQYAAIRLAKAAGGRPWRIFALLMLLTCALSSLLDNITTVLVVGPILLLLADGMGLNPTPFLIGCMTMANLGGAGTLIGDPPNMIIASQAGLSFLDFLTHMLPASAIAIGLTLPLLWLYSRRRIATEAPRISSILSFDESKAITDMRLLKISLVVFGITGLFFIFHSLLNVEPSVLALSGAAFLMFVTRTKPEEIFGEIHWSTLLFIIGLLIIVGALDNQGLMSRLAANVISGAHNPPAVAIAVLWTSFVISALFSSIPATAMMIPLIRYIGMEMSLSSQEVVPLWWSLALGVAIGSSATLLGGISNIVVAGMSEKHGRAEARLTYWRYGRIALPLMLACLALATLYIYLRYFAFR
jgi:Na+/H+ antiporter NhaD/arsenite permease-like protein